MGKKLAKKKVSKRARKQSGDDRRPKDCANEFLQNLNTPNAKQPRAQLVVERNSSGRDENGLDFEDPFGDDFEEEEIVQDNEDAMDEGDDADTTTRTVWNPKVHGPPQADEKLDFDSSAYAAYYALRVQWPCLSFDIIRDHLGNYRSSYPLQFTIAAGTQASTGERNRVHLWKMENICCTRRDGDSDNEDDVDDSMKDEGNDAEAMIEERFFYHPGAVNRIRSCPQSPNVIATWADTGKVHLFDAAEHIDALDRPPTKELREELSPLITFEGHASEGFAMDWSPVTAGRFVSGDCRKFIYCWERAEAGWSVDKVPYQGHTHSVEDLQWSPSEGSVFASCSVDRTIRIWDTRTHKHSMLSVANAHLKDINVISWNPNVAHLLASGSDDGSFKVWDLRVLRQGEPAGFFKWHEAPITSIEWHPQQDSVLAAASEDHSVSVWDMSVELDQEAASEGAKLDGLEIPPQLLFVHRGQQHIKELHFHPQVPSLISTTSLDGFNFFKPDNLEAA